MNPSPLLSGLLLATSMACLAPRLKAEFEADLKRWVGQPVVAFIKAKEEPIEIKPRPQGGQVYFFVLHKAATAPRDPVRFANANGTLGGNTMDMRAPLSCRLILETDATGIILTTRWEGNDCW